MTTATRERSLSDFLRKSGEVLDEVDEHDVLLRRRDGHDVLLVRADREEVVREAVDISSNLLVQVARAHAHELANGLRDRLPWLRFLPDSDQEQFIADFIGTAQACSSLGSFDQLGVLIAQWRNTAYAWSRPELRSALEVDHADEAYDEPVSAPLT
jgi:hypothetical protein